jgi:hypothetical protein
MVRVLDRDDVQRLVSMADAIAAVREAFAAADRGGAVMPAPFGMHLPDAAGEVHVKGAYLTGAPVFAVKTATGFYRNAELGLPVIRAGKGMPDDTLRALVGLHQELARRAREAIATPEEARRANTELRAMMRARDNHMAEIEKLAEDQLRLVGHVSGALTHRETRQMAENLGFELVHVNDLPHSARSVTDLENGRIYLPPASIPGGHGLRSMALQAIAHRLLDHAAPESYAEFLHQRLEINYFASACLMPLTQSVEFLTAAKADRNIAIEDFRDAFGTTHESAALRFTNLATPYLDMTWHFLRVDDGGAVYKA